PPTGVGNDRRGFDGRSGCVDSPANRYGASFRHAFSSPPGPTEQNLGTQPMARRIGSKEVPVTVRKLIPLAAAFGLWAAGPVEAQQMPVPSASKKENQDLADAVATKLKKSGAVGKGSKVDISVRDGVVDLSGTVTSHKQHEEILRTLTSVTGIKRIESAIQVVGEGPAPTAAAPEMMITPAAMTSPA